MNVKFLAQTALPTTSTVKYAFLKAMAGALSAVWVPPAVTFVLLAVPFVSERMLSKGNPALLRVFVDGLVGGLASAGMAFLMGVMLLAIWGVPVLFFLRLCRANHPLVASVAAACLTYWRFVVSPTNGHPFSEDLTSFVVVAAITGYAAGVYARRFDPALNLKTETPSVINENTD